MSEKTKDEWTPGNEPEKEGWYEITMESGRVVPDFFMGNKEWQYWKFERITAYKSITLSAPYVKPEPVKKDRENLCPFCKEKATARHHWDSRGSYYNCAEDSCMMSMPLSKNITEAQKLLHDTYDKINEWTRVDI